MRERTFIIATALIVLGLPSTARAILIEDPTKKVVGGYLESKDGKKLKIKIIQPDGKQKTVEYDLAKVKILHELDSKLLEGLNKSNPKAYVDYAKELATKQNDPEARDTAMRLFLIAAYLDPRQFGHDAMLRMSDIASTPAEARRCKAMAHLLAPAGDTGVLKQETAVPLSTTKTALLHELLKAIQAYRSGQLASAKELASKPGMVMAFNLPPGMMDQKAFLQRCTDAACPTCVNSKNRGTTLCTTCRGKGKTNQGLGFVKCTDCGGDGRVECATCEGSGLSQTIPDDTMRSVIRSELWIIDQLFGGSSNAKKNTETSNWSSILQARQVNPVTILSLETVTEFDPRRCIYRNRTWVAP